MMSKSLLHAQLRRMRGMNYRYHALFFRQINFWIAANVILLVTSLLQPFRAAVLLVPYLIVYAAMQSAFHFHYIIFARRYARALEQKLNQLNGNRALIAQDLEETYLFPLDAPRLVGVNFGNPLTFFTAITLHYGMAGTLTWACALYRAWQLIPSLAPGFAPLYLYVPVTIIWTVTNVLYLAWYSLGQRDEKAMERKLASFLAEKYGEVE